MSVFTIGYQKLTVERLRQVMDKKKIAVLVDVRSIPYGRRPEFNRKKLEADFGPNYVWLGDILGGKFGPAKPAGIQKLVELSSKFPILVMCMEDDPCGCHRYYDIGSRLLREGIDAIHIHGDKEFHTSELQNVPAGSHSV